MKERSSHINPLRRIGSTTLVVTSILVGCSGGTGEAPRATSHESTTVPADSVTIDADAYDAALLTVIDHAAECGDVICALNRMEAGTPEAAGSMERAILGLRVAHAFAEAEPEAAALLRDQYAAVSAAHPGVPPSQLAAYFAPTTPELENAHALATGWLAENAGGFESERPEAIAAYEATAVVEQAPPRPPPPPPPVVVVRPVVIRPPPPPPPSRVLPALAIGAGATAAVTSTIAICSHNSSGNPNIVIIGGNPQNVTIECRPGVVIIGGGGTDGGPPR